MLAWPPPSSPSPEKMRWITLTMTKMMTPVSRCKRSLSGGARQEAWPVSPSPPRSPCRGTSSCPTREGGRGSPSHPPPPCPPSPISSTQVQCPSPTRPNIPREPLHPPRPPQVRGAQVPQVQVQVHVPQVEVDVDHPHSQPDHRRLLLPLLPASLAIFPPTLAGLVQPQQKYEGLLSSRQLSGDRGH